MKAFIVAIPIILFSTYYLSCSGFQSLVSRQVDVRSNPSLSRWIPSKYNAISSSSSSLILYSSSWNDNSKDEEDDYNTESPVEGIRLNKVFKATHSRREADALISDGRVTVNGKKVDIKGGFRVIPYVDIIALDGIVVHGWEDMNYLQKSHTEESTINMRLRDEQEKIFNSNSHHANIMETPTSHFDYVKYWKPEGITCTTDTRKEDNIIDALRREGYKPKHRIYPVGRLDKDSSGLILLTSDGRVPNAVLRGEQKQAKVYVVRVDKVISDTHIQRLQEGIVITTVAHRDGNRGKPLTAKTRPCLVERIDSHVLKITLMEGRNRQIRKMLGALDYTVMELQRIEFMGIQLQDKDALLRGPGDWKTLNQREMTIVETALKIALPL